MGRFNTKETTKTTNIAGGMAYKHSTELELVFAVLTTFLDNKFYESGDERIERIKGLAEKCDHNFVAKLSVYARKMFHLRSVSHLLVSELAKMHRGDSLVWNTINDVAERPDDLLEIAAILDGKMTNQVKKGMRRAILKFSPYQLAKYQGKVKKISLVDLFNLVHPRVKFANDDQKKAWSDLMKGKLKSFDTWESKLSAGEGHKRTWRDLILENKIGYMALLRNLRNIDSECDDETKKSACFIIRDPERVAKSKQLPFRFFNAFEHVSNQEMIEAISDALEHSMDNVPEFKGKTLVAIDTSGSMIGDPIKHAAMLGAALAKSNDAEVVLYDTRVRQLRYVKKDSTMTLTNMILGAEMGGGTETALVFDYAIGSKVKYDRIVILSDNESWRERYYGSGVQDAYNQYRKINDCFVYAIDIAGYGTVDISSPKVRHICGFSEKIFDFMKYFEEGQNLVKTIMSYDAG